MADERDPALTAAEAARGVLVWLVGLAQQVGEPMPSVRDLKGRMVEEHASPVSMPPMRRAVAAEEPLVVLPPQALDAKRRIEAQREAQREADGPMPVPRAVPDSTTEERGVTEQREVPRTRSGLAAPALAPVAALLATDEMQAVRASLALVHEYATALTEAVAQAQHQIVQADRQLTALREKLTQLEKVEAVIQAARS